jgi:serine/threonine protein kinase
VAGLEEESINLSSFEHLKNIAGSYLGAPEYLAPEVVRGAKPDPRSDVYSLGVILYEMLSGQPPFTGEGYLEIAQKRTYALLPALHSIAPDLPIALELVVNRALHRNLDYRFQTPNDLIVTFSHVLEERVHRVKQVPLLPTGEHIRALLAAPSNKKPETHQELASPSQLQSDAHPQEISSEREWQMSDGRTIPPIVALPTSTSKRNGLVNSPIVAKHEKSQRASRGFLPSEPTRDLKPPISSLERSYQSANRQNSAGEKSEAVSTKRTDIAAMAQELHLMMRKLQASLTK